MANVRGVRLTDPVEAGERPVCPVKNKPLRSTDPRKRKVVAALAELSGATKVTCVGVVGEGSLHEKFVGHCMVRDFIAGMNADRGFKSIGWWSVDLKGGSK